MPARRQPSAKRTGIPRGCEEDSVSSHIETSTNMAEHDNEVDPGTCCLCIPSPRGFGLICLYYLFHGFVCVFCIMQTFSINLQSGGYNSTFGMVQVSLGAAGLLFSGIGF